MPLQLALPQRRNAPHVSSASSDFTLIPRRPNEPSASAPSPTTRSRRQARGVGPRFASPPPPRCSPAPRSSPRHPSQHRGGRWCGARGPGAKSEPWRPRRPGVRRKQTSRRRADLTRSGIHRHQEAAEQGRVRRPRTQHPCR